MFHMPATQFALRRNDLESRVTKNIVNFTYASWVRGSAHPYGTKNQLNRRSSIAAEWFLQGKELPFVVSYALLTRQSWRWPWLCILQLPVAEAEWKVPTTASPMPVLSLCLAPGTLGL